MSIAFFGVVLAYFMLSSNCLGETVNIPNVGEDRNEIEIGQGRFWWNFWTFYLNIFFVQLSTVCPNICYTDDLWLKKKTKSGRYQISATDERCRISVTENAVKKNFSFLFSESRLESISSLKAAVLKSIIF